MRNERTLAYLLIGLGAFFLLVRNGGADWLWLALLGAIFLFGYVSRKTYGFLVAGSVLLGIAVGSLIGSQGGMLLSLAAGFFAIDQVERRPNRWPYYTAGILAVLGVLSALGSLGILTSVGFALLLIAAGVYLLYREREKGTRVPYNDAPPYASSPAPVSPTEPKASSVTSPASTPQNAETPEATPPPTSAETVSETPEPIPSAPATQASTPEPPAATVPTPMVSTPTEASRPPTDPGAEERLARLEQWRRDTAAAAGTPSYIVFSNDTLFRIASSNPQTLEELDKIRGVGPVKLERYGSAVLAVLRAPASAD